MAETPRSASRNKVPTSGDASLFNQFGNDATLRTFQTVCMEMTADELRRFCEGSMNMLVVAQDQFRKRFPAEWDTWNAQFDDPEVSR